MRWRKLSDRRLKLLGAEDELGKQLRIDIRSALVFRQVTFIVGPEECLYVVGDRCPACEPVLPHLAIS